MKISYVAYCMTIAAAGAVAGGCTPKGSALKSLDTTSIDETIAVGEDFYGHVNKGWQQAHPLTAGLFRQLPILPD